MASGLALHSAELPPRLQRALRFFSQRLRDRLGHRVTAVKLFGSWARGEATAQSDVDVWVLVDRRDAVTRQVPFEVAHDTLMDHEVDLTPTVMDQAEWHLLVERERRIALDIERDGIAL